MTSKLDIRVRVLGGVITTTPANGVLLVRQQELRKTVSA